MSEKKKLPKVGTKAHQKLKWEESIKDLKEKFAKLELRPSDIDGIGVFATRDIKKGEKLYADELPHAFDIPFKVLRSKKVPKEISDKILGHFPYIAAKEDRAPFIYPVTAMVLFMNHSNKPNYNHKDDTALCDIKRGEELTENYKQIDGADKVYKWLN